MSTKFVAGTCLSIGEDQPQTPSIAEPSAERGPGEATQNQRQPELGNDALGVDPDCRERTTFIGQMLLNTSTEGFVAAQPVPAPEQHSPGDDVQIVEGR